jgi:hypothetical protein
MFQILSIPLINTTDFFYATYLKLASMNTASLARNIQLDVSDAGEPFLLNAAPLQHNQWNC